MKAKLIEEVLDELKSLRKKVKKSAEAQVKVEDKLTHVEALVKALYHQVKDEKDHSDKLDKSAKKSKKSKKVEANVEKLAESASKTDQETAKP